MRAITISREYGSGGGEIAARLATRLSWKLIDHHLVVEVSKLLNESIEETKARDEHAPGFVATLADSLRWAAPLPGWLPQRTTDEEMIRYKQAVGAVIAEAVELGQVVIVGRGGQTLLRDRRDVLHARVVAPLEARIAYVSVRENLDADGARARIHYKDSDRVRYLQTMEHCDPSDAHLYDLIVNTGVLSLDDAVDLIAAALDRKAKREGVDPADLGPGAGLTAYPNQPAA